MSNKFSELLQEDINKSNSYWLIDGKAHKVTGRHEDFATKKLKGKKIEGDILDHCLKELGWKRVATGGVVETWSVGQSDMRAIYAGLKDSGAVDTDKIDLEVRANERFYQNVPVRDFQYGTATSLQKYYKPIGFGSFRAGGSASRHF